jgi:hypothetical protein
MIGVGVLLQGVSGSVRRQSPRVKEIRDKEAANDSKRSRLFFYQ